MSWMQRLWNSFKRESLNSGIDEELAFHIEERAEELVEQGMSLEEARRQASVQLGGYNSFKEEMGEINTFSFIADIGRDLGVGIRMLAQSPAFAATAILSLALGIGANTALFSIVNALMLRSLPVADARQIVSIDSPQIGSILTYPIWEQMRDRQQGFAGLLAYGADKFDLAASGESRFAQGLWVSGDFFRVLGVPAEEGRIFTREEDRRGTLPVAVISDSFRRRNFPAEASVIGKTLRLNRHQFEIVGVTPAWFRGLTVETSFDVAVPLACEPILHSDHSLLDERSGWWLSILGRLKPGTTVAQAETDLKAAAPAILEGAVPLRLSVEEQKQFLQSTFVLHPAATGFSEVRVQYKSALFALMGAACLVLLITCANVANLLLARASARQRELAVRLAVGAARMRIVRQLVTESFLLSVAGTGLGFVLALLGSHALVGLITTAGNPLYIDLSPDWRMLFFTAAIAVLTVLLFGFAPAFRATRYDLNQVLKKDGRGAVPGSTRFHLGKALVAAQIALSLTVLVAASLFVTTLKNLLSTDLGFNGRGVLLTDVHFQENAVPKERRRLLATEMLARLRAIPGVLSAANSFRTPISSLGWNSRVEPEGYRAKSRRDTLVWLNRVSPGYFQTMSTPLLLGRDFAETDTMAAPRVVIIGEATARHFFGFTNAIGKTIGMGNENGSGQTLYYVIGVVKDSKYRSINETERLTGFVAASQDEDPRAATTFEIRVNGSPVALTKTVRDAIVSVSRDVTLQFRDMETQVNDSVLQPRLVALLSTVFGSLALLLATVGLYGITAYEVSRRKSEIGIRIALGAPRRSVIWLALRDTGTLLGAGMAAGVAASLAAGRLVKSLLFDVRPNDPRQVAIALLILAAAAILAAYLPARSAARLDPIETLRDE